MCDYCDSEHPTSCCAFLNIYRLGHGGETLFTSPLEMGVKPIHSVPVDFLGLDMEDPDKIKARRKKVDNLLQKYEEAK